MELTVEQVTEYVKHGGISCPYCGSRNIEAQALEADAGGAYQRVECLSCDANWTDGYTLDHVGSGEADDFEFIEAAGPRIIVEVEGGVLVSVYCSDGGADVDLIDRDNVEVESEASKADAEKLAAEAKKLSLVF